jgi:hypothetical protein
VLALAAATAATAFAPSALPSRRRLAARAPPRRDVAVRFSPADAALASLPSLQVAVTAVEPVVTTAVYFPIFIGGLAITLSGFAFAFVVSFLINTFDLEEDLAEDFTQRGQIDDAAAKAAGDVAPTRGAAGAAMAAVAEEEVGDEFTD